MHNETNRYEEAYEDVVTSIRQKRENFYKEFTGLTHLYNTPSKDKALSLLHLFNNKDVSNLRKVTKPTPAYEFYVAPLLVLFDKKPKRAVSAEGKTLISNWLVAYKLVGDNFCQKLRDFHLEGMT